MENKGVAIFGIIMIGVLISVGVFYIIPEQNQLVMYPYDYTKLPPTVGYYQEIICPITNQPEEVIPVGIVEEHRLDWSIQGTRLNIITIYYCPEHNVEFSAH